MSVSEPNSLPGTASSWSDEDDRRARHEAIWKQSCSRTHQLWCRCSDWTSHIRKRWPTDARTDGAEGTTTGGGGSGGNDGGDLDELVMAAEIG